jgi:hypothetical protein
MSRIVVLSLITLIVAACSSATHTASFTEPKTKATIVIELRHVHPHLAEYDRTVILRRDGLKDGKYELATDTGGYGAANLYKCTNKLLMLDSYSEFVVLDTSTGKINAGKCTGPWTYVGVFDGGGNKPWQFFPASERPEVALVMRGG